MIASEGFFAEYGSDMLRTSSEHLVLTLVAMAIASAIAIPLGIVLARSRHEWLVKTVMGLVNIIQPIPSLALVALTVVVFYLINQFLNVRLLATLGTGPALVALVAYALLPILRNTYTGIRQVDATVVEVATGMGMTPRQILFSVQLPLALPFIMAGVRISTVWTIGVATLVSLVGAGGLGDLIFRGLSTYRIQLILAGAAPAAVLALVFDWLLSELEKAFTPGSEATVTNGSAPSRLAKWSKLAAAGALLLIVVATVVVQALPGRSSGRASASGQPLTAGFTAEFLERPDGYKGLCRAYGFEFPEPPKQMDPGLMYKACANGSVDIICAFATDGRIDAYDLVTLVDDRSYFPPYVAAPLVRGEVLERRPELRGILDRLAGKLDDATMRGLNLQVDREDSPRKASSVARDFLVSAGLIRANATTGDGSAGTVRIGGKDFTEQSILCEIMAILVECSSDIAVDRKPYLGGTMICFNALKSGDLDLYAEYTGTGLVSILGREVVSDPDRAYRIVQEACRKRWNLRWLKPFGLNNTYTITTRRGLAEELGIRTLSDLAGYLSGAGDKD